MPSVYQMFELKVAQFFLKLPKKLPQQLKIQKCYFTKCQQIFGLRLYTAKNFKK